MICRKPEDLEAEVRGLKKVFRENGYPVKRLRRCLDRVRKKSEKSERVRKEEMGMKRLVIPCVAGVSDRIASMARRLGVCVRYSRGRSLCSILCNNKLERNP